MALSPATRFLQALQNTTWVGSGKVFFPTMPSTVEFGCELRLERPKGATKAFFLSTHLESWKAGKRGEVAMHMESGFLRYAGVPQPSADAEASGTVELQWFLAHNFGVTEVSRGSVTVIDREPPETQPVVGGEVLKATFVSESLGCATEVRALRREMTLWFDPEKSGIAVRLRDLFSMATNAVPDVTEHLLIEYERCEQ